MSLGQWHIGIWLYTSHMALMAHVPGHGSAHLLRIQVLFRGQSEFNMHSGRHSSYGSPWYSFKQEHSPSVQTAFTPHGDALSVEHSEDNMHSGRHAGGVPTNCGRQEHTACPLISRHCELGPQGDGWHVLILTNVVFLWNETTSGERISGEPLKTRADRSVVYYLTYGVVTTRTWTWRWCRKSRGKDLDSAVLCKPYQLGIQCLKYILAYSLAANLGRHWHEPMPFCSRHSAFEPQGFGSQGVIRSLTMRSVPLSVLEEKEESFDYY
uniref:Uncharacterized protein n=1 Tax=Glossina pallidipes TaxID=7398 RepID=A0A1A9ZCQ9_GLOPL